MERPCSKKIKIKWNCYLQRQDLYQTKDRLWSQGDGVRTVVSDTPGIFFVGVAAVLWKEETVEVGRPEACGLLLLSSTVLFPVECTAVSILEQVMSWSFPGSYSAQPKESCEKLVSSQNSHRAPAHQHTQVLYELVIMHIVILLLEFTELSLKLCPKVIVAVHSCPPWAHQAS